MRHPKNDTPKGATGARPPQGRWCSATVAAVWRRHGGANKIGSEYDDENEEKITNGKPRFNSQEPC